jgi:ACT domain
MGISTQSYATGSAGTSPRGPPGKEAFLTCRGAGGRCETTRRCNSSETGATESVPVLWQIQVQLPDRPGSLGTVTTLLGRLGVDIHQIVVVERTDGYAVDDMTVRVPGEVLRRCLAQLLEEIPGVYVRELFSVEPAESARP